MHDLGARPVFFVQDTPRAMEFYTTTLGFNSDWTHEENGRSYVAQASLFGLQIILIRRRARLTSVPATAASSSVSTTIKVLPSCSTFIAK